MPSTAILLSNHYTLGSVLGLGKMIQSNTGSCLLRAHTTAYVSMGEKGQGRTGQDGIWERCAGEGSGKVRLGERWLDS